MKNHGELPLRPHQVTLRSADSAAALVRWRALWEWLLAPLGAETATQPDNQARIEGTDDQEAMNDNQ